MKTTTSFTYLLFVFFNISCNNTTKHINQNTLSLDLTQSNTDLIYSSFVDSISYITLSLDTCLISTINKLYFNKDTIILKGRSSEGIFVFTKEGKWVTNINRIGQGPGEYVQPTWLAIDRNQHLICIGDAGSQKILTYDYNGNYIHSVDLGNIYPHDLAVDENGNFITIKAANYSSDPSGVWISDTNYKYLKHLLNDIPKGYELEIITTYYNQSPKHGIYYYDMLKDNIYLLKNNSVEVLYELDLKQKFQSSLRKKGNLSPDEFEGNANIRYFAITDNYMLLQYMLFTGKPSEPIKQKWALLNRKTDTISSYNDLLNDIDEVEEFENYLFFVDDNCICRIVAPKENECNITLQIMHLN